MTAYENLNIKCKLFGIKKKGYIEEILRVVGLDNVGRKKTKHFSLGMKQRLGIGLALVGEPDLLVLDEPINGLDPQGIAEIRDTILRLKNERSMTICISSHILEELSKIATDYGIIHNGSLLQELTRDELMKRCGERMELIRALRTNLGTAGDDVMTDLRWNNEAVSRVTDFMMIPPVNRGSFTDYTCGIPFDEKDDTVWALSHDEVAYERGSYASKMSGGYEDKYADLRLLFGLTMSLPGRKLTFMGQELGGFTGYTFRDLTEDIPGIMNHWEKESIRFDCLYTGYLGSITQIEYVYDLKKRVVKEDGLLIVDPAMADNGSLYYGFDDAFVAQMAKLCGSADIILPNITEAAFMTGCELRLEGQDEAYVQMILEALAKLGCKKIVLKGISFEDDKIGVVVYDCAEKKAEYYFTEKVPKSSHGTGDCYAAAFTGAMMQGKTISEAAKMAADFVVDSIKKTDDGHWYGVCFERALPMLVTELNK